MNPQKDCFFCNSSVAEKCCVLCILFNVANWMISRWILLVELFTLSSGDFTTVHFVPLCREELIPRCFLLYFVEWRCYHGESCSTWSRGDFTTVHFVLLCREDLIYTTVIFVILCWVEILKRCILFHFVEWSCYHGAFCSTLSSGAFTTVNLVPLCRIELLPRCILFHFVEWSCYHCTSCSTLLSGV